MFPTFRKFGDFLDRIDVGGWLMLSLGVFIIALTVLAPAYLDVRKLQAQHEVLHRQASLLLIRQQNYIAFARALERGDPLLIQRVSMQQLHLKPVGTDPLDDASAAPTSKSIDGWMNPQLDAIPISSLTLPDTRLVRLVTGPPRPWVLAFGGWLVLMGLLITPKFVARDLAVEDLTIEEQADDAPLRPLSFDAAAEMEAAAPAAEPIEDFQAIVPELLPPVPRVHVEFAATEEDQVAAQAIKPVAETADVVEVAAHAAVARQLIAHATSRAPAEAPMPQGLFNFGPATA
jgi:hypothetical protein